MRLSIDVSADEHRKLKALAALSGESLKSYILKRVLPTEDNTPTSEHEELRELEAFLANRIQAAKHGNSETKSVSAIFEDELAET